MRYHIIGVLCIYFLLNISASRKADDIFTCTNGKIDFISDAPLEVIKAASQEMKGAINAEQKTFLFSVNVNSFVGFNSGLQRVHFNENYLETVKYPKAVFEGKIIEELDTGTEGVYEIRAKGNLDLHGVKQERIIKGTITVKGNELTIHSQFNVLLEDHNIKIPRVVYQKISPEILVTINAVMKPVQ